MPNRTRAFVWKEPWVPCGADNAADLARELVGRIVKAAEDLKVKCVISPECGHAYTAIRWDGPNLAGKPFGFEVKHILEVLDELSAAGNAPIGCRDTGPPDVVNHVSDSSPVPFVPPACAPPGACLTSAAPG